jgi:hypothetical protein
MAPYPKGHPVQTFVEAQGLIRTEYRPHLLMRGERMYDFVSGGKMLYLAINSERRLIRCTLALRLVR